MLSHQDAGAKPAVTVDLHTSGQWMRNPALDNPRFLVATMAGFFGWKDALPTQSHAQARPLDIGRAQFTFESRCASC
ncbi:MAG: hypothetical protein H7273_00090, partial [Polaromonas sp.]|nr:hypothetical protein [Polaromonas sp.]